MAVGVGVDSQSLTSSPLPLRWLAPESLLSHRFTFSSDVFSFGVACWELITQTHDVPYHTIPSIRDVISLVCTGELELEFDGRCSKSVETIVKRCIDVKPSKRPDMRTVAKEFERIIKEQYTNQQE